MEMQKLANALTRIYFHETSENCSANIAMEIQRCYEKNVRLRCMDKKNVKIPSRDIFTTPSRGMFVSSPLKFY